MTRVKKDTKETKDDSDGESMCVVLGVYKNYDTRITSRFRFGVSTLELDGCCFLFEIQEFIRSHRDKTFVKTSSKNPASFPEPPSGRLNRTGQPLLSWSVPRELC